MQCAALRHGITAGDIKTEMQCTLLNIRQCADFQPDIRYPRNAVLFSLFADNVRRTEGFTKLAPSAVVIIGYGYRKYKPPFCSSSEVSYLKFPHSFTAQAPILTAGPA
ncbi:Uncharacterised protein [Klebsiella pneumoniae]|nr:Uncharacterised protein [Klebsiella pneumoniae]